MTSTVRGHKENQGQQARPRLFRGVLCLLCLLGVLCGEAAAQSEVAVSIEFQRDRLTYHFDNASSFDTPFLVPHFFEQRYVADNVWLVGAVRYVAGIPWETQAGVTPVRTSTADDYDTFVDPDGSVIRVGTTGGMSIRSLRFSQRGEIARRGPLALGVGYRLRIDRTEFGLGHKTLTRNLVLLEASDITTRETTNSEVHEILFGFSAAYDLGGRWGVLLNADIAPMAVGRLVVELPDKYPGQDLVFLAELGTSTMHVSLARRFGDFGLAFTLDAGRTWSYRSTARLSRPFWGLGIGVPWRP